MVESRRGWTAPFYLGDEPWNFPVHTRQSAPLDAKQTLEKVVEAWGFLPNLGGVIAESPAALADDRKDMKTLTGGRLRFTVTRILVASNDDLWRVLGDFGTEHRWSKALVQCERDTPDVRVGTTRSHRLPRPLIGRMHVREVLTELDPGRAFAYALEGPAGPFGSASSRWSTNRQGRSTAVTVEGFFVPRIWPVRALHWPLVRPMLRWLTRRVLGELDAYVVAACARGSLA